MNFITVEWTTIYVIVNYLEFHTSDKLCKVLQPVVYGAALMLCVW